MWEGGGSGELPRKASYDISGCTGIYIIRLPLSLCRVENVSLMSVSE